MTMKGRAAIITGGARGLGAVVARGFADAGMKVAILDRRLDEGRALVQSIGDRACFIACDVSQEAEVESAFHEAVRWLGKLNVLAAAAGLDRPGYKAEEIPLEVWDEVLGVNARGTFLTNRAAFHRMAGGGRIINFASHAGIRGTAERAAYSASKGAILAWTRAAAKAWGKNGITVNAVAPQMRSEVAERYLSTLTPESFESFRARLSADVPIAGRLGEPEQEFLPLMLFLAGDGARFITGQVFAVDGGMTMVGS